MKKGKILAGTAVLCLLGFWLLRPDPAREGREYITAAQKKKPEELSQTLLQKRKQEVAEELSAGTLDVSAMISDYCIIGDSRAQSLGSAGLSEPSRTFTTIGTTVMDVDNHLEEVKNLKPANIILIYGLNDICSNLNGLEGGWGAIYEEYVNKLLEVDPGARIFVSPVIQVSEAAKVIQPLYNQIDDYNRELQAMCEKNGWHYMDYSSLEVNEESFDTDGEHFNYYWLFDWYAVIADNVWSAQT